MTVILTLRLVFFFNDTATTEIYTLSLHDALPISATSPASASPPAGCSRPGSKGSADPAPLASGRRASGPRSRSEEHTSELQSRQYLVCRFLLEKIEINQSIFLN